MAVESQAQQYPFIDASEAQEFKRCKFPAYYWWAVLHEPLGHGTGRMIVETEEDEDKYNFDIDNPLSTPSPDSQSHLGTNPARPGPASLKSSPPPLTSAEPSLSGHIQWMT